MAKIYETTTDLTQDVLVQKTHEEKRSANDTFVIGILFAGIGGLLHLVDQAKNSIPLTQSSKTWEFFAGQGNRIPKAAKIAAYLTSGFALIESLIHHHDFKKSQSELLSLGRAQRIIVGTDSADQLQYVSNEKGIAKIPNNSHQAHTIIETSDAQTNKLQKDSLDKTP